MPAEPNAIAKKLLAVLLIVAAVCALTAVPASAASASGNGNGDGFNWSSPLAKHTAGPLHQPFKLSWTLLLKSVILKVIYHEGRAAICGSNALSRAVFRISPEACLKYVVRE